MTGEILQQLRDIHEPAVPVWFPPAPGWWLLFALVLLVVAAGGFRLRRFRLRQRPYRACRDALETLYARYDRGELDTRGYVDGANEVLKRLLVRVERYPGASKAAGDAWLALLARRFDEPAFLDEAGSLMGVDRFRRKPTGDARVLAELLSRSLERCRLP